MATNGSSIDWVVDWRAVPAEPVATFLFVFLGPGVIIVTGSLIGSLDPAQTLGPALVANAWADHWVYWAGPLAGAAPAGLGYKLVFQGKRND